MLLKTFSSGRPRPFWTASLMRRFAWCIRRRERSSSVNPCFSRVSLTICGIAVVARRKTWRPSTIGTVRLSANISGEKYGKLAEPPPGT
jgi:hypothetical protein